MSERGVTRGRLRVDAARAIAKLREYQLADPNAWLQEVVRAAAALGATKVHAHGDADDIFVAWEGGLVDSDVLPRLFDELVNPTTSESRRGLRLLATGVNAALGMSPRWVRVYRVEGASCALVSYSPELLLDEDGDGKSGLADLEIAEEQAPDEAPQTGMLLRFRRRLSGQVVRALVTGSEAKELRALRRAADDSSLPVRVGAGRTARDRSSTDLLRVALGRGLDGFVAVTRASSEPRLPEHPLLVAAELGVHIVSRPHAWIEGAVPRALPPLRLFVNAPRMPTNAARSDVRADDPPIADAIARAQELLPEVCAKLVAGLERGGEDWQRAALSLLAFATAGSLWSSALELPPGFAALAAAPLLRDAAGRRCSLERFAGGPRVAHLEQEPVPEELADLLGDVIWLPPGDPAWVLMGGGLPPSASERVNEAFEQRAARLAWQERAPLNAPLETSGELLGRLTLSAPELPEAGSVEVALTTAGAGSVSFRYEGREVERVRSDVGFGLSASVQFPGLEPTDSYDAVKRNQSFHRAMLWVRLAADRLAEEFASEALAGDGCCDEHRARIIRVALGHLAALKGRKLSPPFRRVVPALRDGALTRARVWSRPDGTALSTRELSALWRKGRVTVVCREGRLPPTEIEADVLVLDDASADALRSLTAASPVESSRLVYYDPPPHGGPRARAAAAGREAAGRGQVSLIVAEEHRRGAIAWGVEEGFISFSHLGKPLGGRRRECALLPALFFVDDDRILPDSDWKETVLEPPLESLDEWERSLARAVADDLLGRRVPGLQRAGVEGAGAHLLLLALGHADDAAGVLGEPRLKALLNRSLIPVLGSRRARSIAEWAAATPEGPLPYVQGTKSAGLAMREFEPAVLEREVAAAAASLVDRSVYDAESELRDRRREGRRRAGRERFLRKPQGPTLRPPDGAHVKLRGGTIEGYLSLPRGGPSRVALRIERRTLGVLPSAAGLPVHAVLEGDWSLADDDALEPAEGLPRRLKKMLQDGAGRLLVGLARTKPELLFADEEAHALLTGWLVQPRRPKKLVESLRALPFWPSVQGPLVSLEQATRKGRVRTARWSGEWLGQGEGKKSSLDRPILQIPEDSAAAPTWDMLKVLAGDRAITDSTRSVRKLQSQRRVSSGKVPRPTLKFARGDMSFDLAELGSGGRELINILGPGTGALYDGEGAVLRLFDSGSEEFLVCGELRPALELAIESPVQAERVRRRQRHAPKEFASTGEAEQARLKRLMEQHPEANLAWMDLRLLAHMRRAVRLLVTATLERLGDELSPWLRRQLRLGVAQGTLDDEALERELFPTTSGDFVSFRRIEEEVARRSAVWFTLDATQRAADLPDGRLALILSPRERSALGEHIRLVDTTDELRRASALTALMAQEPLEELRLSADQRDATLVLTRLPRVEGEPGHGLVAPLTPEGSHMRKLERFLHMRPLDERADACEWPTLCLIDDDDFEPTIGDPDESQRARLDALNTRLRAASEAALEQLFEAPEGALAKFAMTDESVRRLLGRASDVRGALWIGPGLSGGGVDLQGQGFRVALVPKRRDGTELPLSGRLLTTSRQHLAAHAEAQALCFAALPIMVREVLGRLKSELALSAWSAGDDYDDLDAQLVIVAWAGLSEVLSAAEVGALPLPCVAPAGRTMQLLMRLVRSDTRLEVLTPAQAQEVSPVDPVLVDDGSALSRLLIERLGVRPGSGTEGSGREPAYVICDRLNLILRQAELAEGWLPIRPGRGPANRLIEVTPARGARLNQRCRSVRQLSETVASGRLDAAAGVAQLAAHVLSLWFAKRGVRPSGDDGVAAMIRLMQAADEAAEEPLD